MAPEADREPRKLISYPDLLGTRLIFVTNLSVQKAELRTFFIYAYSLL